MVKAHLIFTKYINSYSVRVDNLEKLSVEQIKQLQHFVEVRNGIFDFEIYTFVIQKKLEFSSFVKLIEMLEIKAVCQEQIKEKKSFPRVGFGQYKGMQYNELPDSYLVWLKNNYHGSDEKIIFSELKRRNI